MTGTYDLLLQTPSQALFDALMTLLSFIPRIVAALVILLLGWVLGRFVSLLIRRAGRALKLERRTMDTLLGRAIDRPGAILRLCGMAGAFYVYLIAALGAVNVLGLTAVAALIGRTLSFLPSLFAGALFLVVGFAVVEFASERIERIPAGTRTSAVLANGACILLYAAVVVMGLDTMGVDTGVLYVVLAALAGGIGLAFGVGAGLAIGFGGWPYVAANIDDWVDSALESTRNRPETSPETRAGRSETSPETVGHKPVEGSWNTEERQG